MKTLELFEKELKKEYPSKIVSDLKRTNPELYVKLRDYSKEHNTSIKNLLEENDYVYLRKSIIRLYVDDFIELEKAFPDYKIHGFYENNNKLYYRVLSHAKVLKVSLKKYLNSLGFDYDARDGLSNNGLVKDLLILYPNKNVKNLSSTDSKLYYRVYQSAKKENLEVVPFLENLGFSVDKSEKKTREEVKQENNKKKPGRPKKIENVENENKVTKKLGRPKKNVENKETKTENNKKKVGRPKKIKVVENKEKTKKSKKIDNTKNKKTISKKSVSKTNKNIENKKKVGRPKKTKTIENNTSNIQVSIEKENTL